MSEEILSLLHELMASQPDVSHGQVFDDGRRWCQACAHPRHWDASKADDGWKHRVCPVCSAVWPEYVEEFVESAMHDEIDDFAVTMVH